MDYYSSGGVESMDIAYVRYGQVQEPINSQYSSTTQPVQYRNSVPYSSRSQYKVQSQYPEEPVQYVSTPQYDDYEEGSTYESGGHYVPVQYESTSSNYRGATAATTGSQYSSRPQSSWQQKKVPEQDHYAQGNTHQAGLKGFSTKSFSRGSTTGGSTATSTHLETVREQPAATRTRGRGISTAPAQSYSAPRARGFQNSQWVSGSTSIQSSSNVTEDKYSSRVTTKPSRGKSVYPKAEVAKPKVYQIASRPQTGNDFSKVPLPKPITIAKKEPSPVPQRAVAATLQTSNAVNTGINKGVTNVRSTWAQPVAMETSIVKNQDGVASGTKKTENGEKKPWITHGKIRKRKKATSAERNLRLKKYVMPRNAMMCLNDLVQGVVYNVETEETGPAKPLCVSVEVKGLKYKGYGVTKVDAKMAAAEAALASFVKPPTPGIDGTVPEDNTPWAVLASFAMFKLFNEWREGKIGVSAGANSNIFGTPMVQDATLSQTFQKVLDNSIQMATAAEDKVPSDVFDVYLGCKDGKSDKQVPNPAKNIPENAATMHPVMLLHQLRPQLVYLQSSIMKGDKTVFTLSCDIDNMNFVGEGANMKKAKYDLAVKAIQALFDIKSVYQPIN